MLKCEGDGRLNGAEQKGRRMQWNQQDGGAAANGCKPGGTSGERTYALIGARDARDPMSPNKVPDRVIDMMA